MKKLIILGALFLGLIEAKCYSQTITQTADGNYIAVKAAKDSTGATSAKNTGKTFTDTKGNKYPVMISKNGKLFVVRVSKTGNKYNQYLKVN